MSPTTIVANDIARYLYYSKLTTLFVLAKLKTASTSIILDGVTRSDKGYGTTRVLGYVWNEYEPSAKDQKMNMNKRNLLLLLFPILFAACDNEETKFFLHTDLEPDKTVTSMIPYPWTSEDVIKNNISYMNGEGYNGMVRTAWATMWIDMNNDNKIDFGFNVKHSYEMEEIEGKYYYYFLIYISAAYDNEVSLSDFENGYIRKYSYGEALDYESFGKTPIRYQVEDGGYLVRIEYDNDLQNNGEFYIAVKAMRDNKPYYGWFLVETNTDLLTVTVKEFALCKLRKKEIIIGEKD